MFTYHKFKEKPSLLKSRLTDTPTADNPLQGQFFMKKLARFKSTFDVSCTNFLKETEVTKQKPMTRTKMVHTMMDFRKQNKPHKDNSNDNVL